MLKNLGKGIKKGAAQLNHEIDKGTKQLDKEADKLGKDADQSVANQIDIKPSHLTNSNASDHKEQVDATRKALGLRKNEESTCDTTEELSEDEAPIIGNTSYTLGE